MADVYEREKVGDGSARRRRVIWLNPETGFPVQWWLYAASEQMPQHVVLAMDEILVNDDRESCCLFRFHTPEGYELLKQDRGPEDIVPMDQLDRHAHHLAVRFSFDIGNKVVLACWASYDDSQSHPLDHDLGPGLLPRELLEPVRSRSGHLQYRHLLLGSTGLKRDFTGDGRCWCPKLQVPRSVAIRPSLHKANFDWS